LESLTPEAGGVIPSLGSVSPKASLNGTFYNLTVISVNGGPAVLIITGVDLNPFVQ